MKKTIWKKTRREIRQSIGRYLAILAIVALGVGFFAGLQISRPSMVKTADHYLAEHHFFDYHLMNTYGYDKDAPADFAALPQVEYAEGSVFTDALISGNDGTDRVFKLHSLPDQVNTISLVAGRMPENNQECLGDSRYFTKENIGTTLTISSENNEDTMDMLAHDTFTIVGLVNSPYYLNHERGSSSLGNGNISGYLYLPKDSFDTDYYSEIFLTLKEKNVAYSEAYTNRIDAELSAIEEANKNSADKRYHNLKQEIDDEIADGEQELADAKEEYQTNKADAEQKLSDAKAELEQSELDISNAEQKILDSETKFTLAQSEISNGLITLNQKKEELETARTQLESGWADLAVAEATAQPVLDQLNAAIAATPPELQNTEAFQALMAQKAQIETPLEASRNTLNTAQAQYDAGISAVAAAEAQLNESNTQLISIYAQLQDAKAELATGKQELADGWDEYYSSKAEADSEFADAEIEITDAETELVDAREELKDFQEPSVYTLDRTSNIGYVCFDNDSNIVAGVAKVFPIFFFMVAALVCMTTMTRMIDEQRTLIGAMKALGYGNGAIMGNYLFYAGSAALIGCISGFAIGSYVFPFTIWKAYSILYNNFAPIQIIFDWKLAFISIIVSLLCSIGAAWFACYRELTDVPANLIRPAAPKGGKHILLERIPFIWRRLPFLHKISIRNILRYKKRLFMMILGISGCTALLLTGLGLLDSIQNIVSAQYTEISLYDYTVTFHNELNADERKEFINDSRSVIDSALFAHEGSIDLITEKETKPIRFVVPDAENLDSFVDLHLEDTAVSYPKKGEVILNEQLAKNYGLKIGDTVTLRDSDMHTLTLTLSGVFDNYVYNYAYVSKDSCLEQWGFIPEMKTAYIHIPQGIVPHNGGAVIMQDDKVSNIIVNADMEAMINNMLSSLNSVVLLVICCAGALAFIVLYNLTNINILERIREIATIKVLGFHPAETAGYVFREILALTGIGALIGLGLGKLLHAFVMSQIKIDMVSFDNCILPSSYLFAFFCTFLFAGLVCFAMYFRLKKIDMAQSLKSIE